MKYYFNIFSARKKKFILKDLTNFSVFTSNSGAERPGADSKLSKFETKKNFVKYIIV